MANEILNQVKRSLKPPFELLSASKSSTSDHMEQMKQIQSKNSEKSSKSLKKYSNKIQKHDFGHIERRRDH